MANIQSFVRVTKSSLQKGRKQGSISFERYLELVRDLELGTYDSIEGRELADESDVCVSFAHGKETYVLPRSCVELIARTFIK